MLNWFQLAMLNWFQLAMLTWVSKIGTNWILTIGANCVFFFNKEFEIADCFPHWFELLEANWTQRLFLPGMATRPIKTGGMDWCMKGYEM